MLIFKCTQIILANPCHNPLMDYLNPCQNGGTCTFDANFTVTCACLPEWTGDACEIRMF